MADEWVSVIRSDGQLFSGLRIKLEDNGDDTYSLSIADNTADAQRTSIISLLTEIRDLLSNPLDVSIV